MFFKLLNLTLYFSLNSLLILNNTTYYKNILSHSLNFTKMKKILSLIFLISSFTGYSQNYDCSKLKIVDYRIDPNDTTFYFQLENKNTEKILVSAYIDSAFTYNPFKDLKNHHNESINLLTDTILEFKTSFKNLSQFNKYDFKFVIETHQQQVCRIEYEFKDTLDCKHIRLRNDTISIDLNKTGTDLTFTYDILPFSYPNYTFTSKSNDLLVLGTLSQTYLLFNKDCISYGFCSYYEPYGDPGFKSDLQGLNYIDGIFTIGHLNKNSCDFNIIYKFEGNQPLAIEESFANTSLFSPNPVKEQINLHQKGNWEIYSVYGKLVKNGSETSISVSGLPKGSYVLKIGDKAEKFIKE